MMHTKTRTHMLSHGWSDAPSSGRRVDGGRDGGGGGGDGGGAHVAVSVGAQDGLQLIGKHRL